MTPENLLLNGSLEDPFVPYRGDEKLTTAAAWMPWWVPQRATDPSWMNQLPRFSAAEIDDRPAQLVSSPMGTHTAGILQQVPAVRGDRYELLADVLARSSESLEALLEPSDPDVQIGVDPSGGLDATSPLVRWSDRQQPLGRWETMRLAVQAQSSILTIFLRSAPQRPKRMQEVYWRSVTLRPLGRPRRATRITGPGETTIVLTPEDAAPGSALAVTVQALRSHAYVSLLVLGPDDRPVPVHTSAALPGDGDKIWRYGFTPESAGVYDVRFVGDGGARLLAQQLLRVSPEAAHAPVAGTESHGDARVAYQRVYVLLPPTADVWWLLAAARGAFERRFTIGFSADDAGVGNLTGRHVLAVNPHHWTEPLTAAWFQRHYPGTRFTAVVAAAPADLESWLQNWEETI